MAVDDVFMTREELENFSSGMKVYAEDAKDELLSHIGQPRRPFLPREVLIDIQSWMDGPESKFIWVEGPAFSSVGPELSLMALRLSLSAMNAGIPSISFFAKRRYNFQKPNMPARCAGIIALAYTLISQLICLVPPSFTPPRKLSKRNLEQLDGSLGSYKTALDILETLLTLAPPSLICVIDALETIDHRETCLDLTKLIDILRCHEKTKTIKILFSTSGNCRALMNTTDMRERVSAQRIALARGASPLPGAADVGELNIRARR